MLHSGTTGNILIPQMTDSVMMIPQKATYEVQNMKYVYVVNDSNIAHSRIIKVSPISDGANYVVTEGLKVGEVIVTEGVGTKVREGSLIAPAQAAATEEKAAENK